MLHDEVPFDFDERVIDPTGRIIRQSAPAPRPRRRRSEPVVPQSLEELLKASIREVVEREIRKAQTESDLSELLRRSLEDVRRREKAAK
jgi:hypothetical protein